MKDNIISAIKQKIDNIDTRDFSIEKVIKTFDKINDTLEVMYLAGAIDEVVSVSAVLQKWIDDEDGLGIASADAESWDDAEELVVIFAIERHRPRKNKKFHEEIIEECMPLLSSLVPMKHFVDTCDEGISQFRTISRIGQYDCFESVGFYNFYKQNFYDNHKKFHGIV